MPTSLILGSMKTPRPTKRTRTFKGIRIQTQDSETTLPVLDIKRQKALKALDLRTPDEKKGWIDVPEDPVDPNAPASKEGKK
jgi:hypothetical protein